MEALSPLPAQQGAGQGEGQRHQPDDQDGGNQSHGQVGQGHSHRQGIQTGRQGQGSDFPPFQPGDRLAGLGPEGGEQLDAPRYQEQAEGRLPPPASGRAGSARPLQTADQGHAGLKGPEPAGQPAVRPGTETPASPVRSTWPRRRRPPPPTEPKEYRCHNVVSPPCYLCPPRGYLCSSR